MAIKQWLKEQDANFFGQGVQNSSYGAQSPWVLQRKVIHESFNDMLSTVNAQ